MILYGMAVAVVPKKGDPSTMQVTCTPISVEDKKREEVKTLEKPHGFKKEFRLNDTARVMECFADIAETLDAVVELQKTSCRENKVDYQPVALCMGEDYGNPLPLDALYLHLFGERLFEPEAASDARENDAKNKRSDYLKTHGSFPTRFAKACQKLPRLLEQCTFQEGAFTRAEVPPGYDANLMEQEEVDLYLLEQKRIIDAKEEGAGKAHAALREIVRRLGKSKGEQATENPNIFQMELPKNYVGNEENQRKFPVHVFVHWHPDYREAFYEGFKETYKGRFNRHFKLPLDPPSAFFVDPCADRICDQFEVVAGTRSPDDVIDSTEWRHQMIQSARRAWRLTASAASWEALGAGKDMGSRGNFRK